MVGKPTHEQIERELERLREELKKARIKEKNLLETASYYKSIFELGTDGIVILDPVTVRPIDYNNQACRQLGYSRDEFSSLSLQDIEVKEDQNDIRAHIDKVIENGFDSFETLHRTKGGEIRNILVIAQFFSTGDRNVYHCLWRDITDWKKTEEELLRSQDRYHTLYEQASRAEKLYRSLIDSSADAIVLYNLAGEVQYVSPSFSNLFGWQLDEIKGKRIPFVPDTEKERTLAEIRRVLTTGEPSRNFHTKRFTKSGQLLEIYISSSRYDDTDGNPIGLLVILKDMTEKMAMEKHLRQSQKMESVGLLAGGIAHDFNNLLTPILGYAQLLSNQFSPREPQFSQLSQIILAADRARSLVSRLLSFSRKQIVEFKNISLETMIQQFRAILRRTIRENIVINISVAPSLGLIKADQGQIEQILINLSINAQDAMPNGGTLTIEAADVDLDPTSANANPEVVPGPYVMLAVCDTGTGMDADTLEHIFDPFFTTKELGQGTGLGLSTVYGIVKMHGGAITVNSEKQSGTRFTIYLPRLVGDGFVQQIEAIESREPVRGTETVLIVEDDRMVRNLAASILQDLGYRVLVAETPARCLELASKNPGPIHLLLTDIILPDMNGKELFDRLSPEFPNLKVLFMSGYTTDVVLRHGVLYEGVHFLQKPFSVFTLSKKIRDVLDA